MTPRIPAFDEPPPRLIDPATGAVTVRLYPYYLKRLHGEWPAGLDEAEATPPGGPFPLLPGSQPVEIVLRPGMAPSEVGPPGLIEVNTYQGDLSWWQWLAYMQTPLGWTWVCQATFTRGWLTHFSMLPHLEEGPREFSGLEQALNEELGPPHEGNTGGFRLPFPGRPRWARGHRRWIYPWGEVKLFYESREWNPMVGITWSAERL